MEEMPHSLEGKKNLAAKIFFFLSYLRRGNFDRWAAEGEGEGFAGSVTVIDYSNSGARAPKGIWNATRIINAKALIGSIE